MASRDVPRHTADHRGPGTGAKAEERVRAGSRFKRYAWLLLVLVALSAVALALAPRVLGRSVHVVQLEHRALVQTVVTSGRVLPPAEITLSALVPGDIQSVAVEEGDPVHKGQLLVQIDPTEAGAALAQAKAALSRARARRRRVHSLTAKVAGQSLEQARARLDQAKLSYQREKQLFAGGATTRSALDDAQTALDLARSAYASAEAQAEASSPQGAESQSAAASIAQARAELAAAEARLERARVVAPSDGVVLTRSVEPGDVVQPGAQLLVVAGSGRIQLVVEPDEKNLALLEVGQTAVASAEAFPSQRFPAKVAFIAPSVDARRGTIKVKLDLDKPPAYLRPAMTVSVEIEVNKRKKALVIDAGAVRDLSTDHPWLLVAKDGVAQRADVKLGLKGDRSVEIASGAPADALVIPPSETGIQPGTRVRPRLPGG